MRNHIPYAAWAILCGSSRHGDHLASGMPTGSKLIPLVSSNSTWEWQARPNHSSASTVRLSETYRHPAVAHHHDPWRASTARTAPSAFSRSPATTVTSPPFGVQPGAVAADRLHRPAGTARPLAEGAVSAPNGPPSPPPPARLSRASTSSTVVCKMAMARRAAVRSA